jgi:amino-acid N-acetyltransferase
MAMSESGPVTVRQARTTDVRAIRRLIDEYSGDGHLLSKATVTLFEDIQEFVVAEVDGQVVGCGALHVMWEDLAEVRTLAVAGTHLRRGIGSHVLNELVARASMLGIRRLFCLTFMVNFFGEHGFVEIDDSPIEHDVYEQMLQSYDEGVAEFLGLERVKPNTLGNHRMIRVL